MDLNNDETEYMPGENPEKLDKAYRDDTFAYCSIILGEEKQLWSCRAGVYVLIGQSRSSEPPLLSGSSGMKSVQFIKIKMI